MSTETLARDVAWETSGHLSEVALSVAADGEDTLLDAAMHEHLRACEACGSELGRVALRSAVVASAFGHAGDRAFAGEMAAEAGAGASVGAAARAAPVVALAVPVIDLAFAPPAALSVRPRPRERRKVPVGALGAALLVALLGAAPSLITAPASLGPKLAVVRKVAPSFFRLLPQVVSRAWTGSIGSMVVLSWAFAVVLVAIGAGIAKQASKASKKAALDGGRR